MKKISGLLLLVLLSPAACFGRDSLPTVAPTVIGVTARNYEDPVRRNWLDTGARPLRVTVWYPAELGGKPEQPSDSRQQGQLHRDAPVAGKTAQYPLILLSHGSGGDAAQLSWLGQYLSEHGSIAAAVNHNGTAEEERHFQPIAVTDFLCWERPRDLSVVLNQLLADAQFSRRIDPARVGVAGFSLGGTTAIWTAGARLDLEILRKNSPPPPPFVADVINRLIAFSSTDPIAQQSVSRANHSYKDVRIKSVFALAPPMGVGFTPEALKEVNVPVYIVVGDADLIAPAASNAKHFADNIPHARLITLPGERGHYLKPIPNEQRDAEMKEVAKLALDFFDETLRARK